MSKAGKKYQEYCGGCKAHGVDPLPIEEWLELGKKVSEKLLGDFSPGLRKSIEEGELGEAARKKYFPDGDPGKEDMKKSDEELGDEIIKSLKRAIDEESHEG